MTYDQPIPQPVQGPYYPPVQRSRPLGVTILAILGILYGILLLIGALALLVVAFLFGSQEFIDMLGQNLPQWLINAGTLFFGVLGIVVLIMAIIAFLLAWGFLRGKRWSWWLGIIFAALNILGSVVSAVGTGTLSGVVTLGISILIPVIILIYLLLPTTKAWFTQ
jgi:hypothetical protein